MSRERYQTADVIFMPYNYLLDHKAGSGCLFLRKLAHTYTSKHCVLNRTVKAFRFLFR
jgi:hypothetical protein